MGDHKDEGKKDEAKQPETRDQIKERAKKEKKHFADLLFPGIVENGVAVKDVPGVARKGTKYHAESGHGFPPPIASLRNGPQHATLLHWKEQAERGAIHICPEDGCYYPLNPVLDEANGNQPLVVAVLTEDVQGVGKSGAEISLLAAGKVPLDPEGKPRYRRALVHVCSWDPAHAGGRVLVRPPQRKQEVPDVDDIPKAKLARGFSSVGALLAFAALSLAAVAVAGNYTWSSSNVSPADVGVPDSGAVGALLSSDWMVNGGDVKACVPVIKANDAGCEISGGAVELDRYFHETRTWGLVSGSRTSISWGSGLSQIVLPEYKVEVPQGRLYLRPVDVTMEPSGNTTLPDGGEGPPYCPTVDLLLVCRT